MKLIVGLGNPGKEYHLTRHNIGFEVIDALADHFQTPLNQTKFNGHYTIVHYEGEKFILLKPLTYMNLSGECIVPLMDYYDIDEKDIVVIYDDLDLPVGKMRLRQKGSSGGHNGIKSIIQHLGTQTFNRIRLGIDRPQGGMKVVDYVLGRYTKEEWPEVERSIMLGKDACISFLRTPFLEVMNEFN